MHSMSEVEANADRCCFTAERVLLYNTLAHEFSHDYSVCNFKCGIKEPLLATP